MKDERAPIAVCERLKLLCTGLLYAPVPCSSLMLVVSSLQTVTFNVIVLDDGSAIKTSKGVANEELEESKNQAGYLLTSVQPDTVLSDVALFIDVNSESVTPEATTKDWWR